MIFIQRASANEPTHSKIKDEKYNSETQFVYFLVTF